ncbi:MAG TPA: ABC transporter permease [Thermomicrobiales bacterium]|nr:ABC transporter permease [Thermomicrobiales bacterium]
MANQVSPAGVGRARPGGQALPRLVTAIRQVDQWRRAHGPTVLLLLPLLVYMALAFAIPVGYQVAFGFYSRKLYKGVLWLPEPDFTLQNFRRVFSETEYLHSLGWTVGVALSTSAVSITLALPIAYFLARYNAFGRPFIELSFLLPIFGEMFTLYAIAYALTPQGPVNWLLTSVGGLDHPLQLTRSPQVAIIWMSIPTLSVLLIRGAIAGVDVVYEEAAQTMGASGLRTFCRVTVPLARRGIVGALLLSVSAAVGAYTVPLVLVGPTNQWLVNKIQLEVKTYYNYPMASALGVVLTAISGLLLYVYLRTQET